MKAEEKLSFSMVSLKKSSQRGNSTMAQQGSMHYQGTNVLFYFIMAIGVKTAK